MHAREHKLDPALMAAVIYQESKFRPSVESSSGAIGLMQLTPATARGIAIRTGGSAFQTSDLYNPEINIRYGAWYLDNLFAKYHDERLVLAAYNAGQGNVDKWLAHGESIQFAETRAYVAARRAPQEDLREGLALTALPVAARARSVCARNPYRSQRSTAHCSSACASVGRRAAANT